MTARRPGGALSVERMGKGCFVMTRKLPAWMERRGGRPALVKERVAVVRLRAALRRVVDGVFLVVVPRGRDWLMVAQFDFVGGRRRSYLVFARAPAANRDSRRPGRLFCQSWKDEAGF